MVYSTCININNYCKFGVSLFDFQRFIADEGIKKLISAGEFYGELLDKSDYAKMSLDRFYNVDKDKAIIRILDLSLTVNNSSDNDDKCLCVKYESTGIHPYYNKLLSDKYFYNLHIRLGREANDVGTDRAKLISIDVNPRVSLSIDGKLRYERLFNKK